VGEPPALPWVEPDLVASCPKVGAFDKKLLPSPVTLSSVEPNGLLTLAVGVNAFFPLGLNTDLVAMLHLLSISACRSV
jgi:hypothetical protein